MPGALATVLYSRSYCHLCDEFLLALAPWRARGAIEVSVVDVDSTPELEARFGELVPVLTWSGGEICHYHLDGARLDEVLSLVR